MACGLAAVAQTPTDVPRGHWAYDAVTDLANKGFVTGYPDGKFLGDRTLSRYEFATIVKRVVDSIDEKMTKAAAETTPETTSQPGVVSTESVLTPADLADVRKLIDEFKIELTVIGTRIDRVETQLAQLEGKVENINSIVTDPEGAFETAKSDISKLRKVTLSGYLQNRYQTLQNPEDKKALHTDDTFFIRRARVKVTAKPTDKSVAVIQLDAGGSKVTVKDAYVQYNTATDQLLGPSYTVGQQNWWFGYEVPYSSSRRETPERALWARRFFQGERDRGLVLTSPIGPNWLGTLGVYDGSGIDTVNTLTSVVTDVGPPVVKTNIRSSANVANDYNNKKDVLANLKYSSPNVEFGVSGYLGDGIWNKDRTAMNSTTDKVRYGADFRYYWDRLTFKSEYCRAKGIDATNTATFNPNDWVDGYNLQLNLNVTRADELVARYESLSQDPLYPQYGRRSAWNLGYIRFIDDNQKFKLFYLINQEQRLSFPNNSFIAEWLVTY
jgi:hypothetical protein